MRASGFVSDVQVIDDYPSHYRAYIRRKHRWLRGDWQIVEWLFPRVPDESGNRVPNPISFIARWKILDNLRRSLIEIAIFVLLVLGWTVLPGRPLYWTAVTLAILFVPPWVQFALRSPAGRAFRQPERHCRCLASLGTALVSVAADAYLPAAQCLGCRGCHCADAVSPHGFTPAHAGMGNRGGSRTGQTEAHSG